MSTFRERMILTFGVIGGAIGMVALIVALRGDVVGGSIGMLWAGIIGYFGMTVHR